MSTPALSPRNANKYVAITLSWRKWWRYTSRKTLKSMNKLLHWWCRQKLVVVFHFLSLRKCVPSKNESAKSAELEHWVCAERDPVEYACSMYQLHRVLSKCICISSICISRPQKWPIYIQMKSTCIHLEASMNFDPTRHVILLWSSGLLVQD